MIKRRVIAAVVALLLASMGAVLLFSYVRGADQRAMAGMETVKVLVVTSPIPEGTAADAILEQVVTKVLPVKAVAAQTISDLDQIAGQVTTTALQPGEQLLASRFADPASLEKKDELVIPKGTQQISVSLQAQRVLGGDLAPGATVGIFISMAKEDTLPAQTSLMLNKVLVTKVVGGTQAPVAEGPEEPAAPVETVTVTFAVKAGDAEKIIYGAEHARLWLSLEVPDSVETGTRVVTAENINE